MKARAKARKKAATTDGLVVSPRARFGFTAAAGTTDDARIRDINQALPPQWADRLFTAHEQGANEQQLQQIAAEPLPGPLLTPAPAQAVDPTETTTLADAVHRIPVADERRDGYTRTAFKHWNAGAVKDDGCNTRADTAA